MQSVTRSVLVRAVRVLARSGLILAMLPVRAAAIPQPECPRSPVACERSAVDPSAAAPDELCSFAGTLERR